MHNLSSKHHLRFEATLGYAVISVLLLSVVLAAPVPGRSVWAGLLLLVVPTFLWASAYGKSCRGKALTSALIGLALVYVVSTVVMLLVHYIPGPISRNVAIALLALLNGIPVFFLWRKGHWSDLRSSWNWQLSAVWVVALLFRVVRVLYNEIEGDEALILLQSAQAIGGQDDVIFWHKKGPVELLIPIIAWLGNGTVNEAVARLPFVVLGLGAVLATYELGRVWSDRRTALLAAALTAVNGYFIAYGRIVQYQSAILFMLPMAFLCLRRGGRSGAFLSGLFVGFALLSHYDAVMVLPAFGYALLTLEASKDRCRLPWHSIFLAGVGMLLVTVPFYVPFLLSPGFSFAFDYLTGARLASEGSSLVSNFARFLSVDAVYNSSYYLITLSLMLFAAVVTDISRWRTRGHLIWQCLLLLVAGALALAVGAQFWGDSSTGWVAAVVGLVLASCLTAPGVPRYRRILWIWFATSFLFYFFFVGDPRTHFYNVFLPWIFLAADASIRLWSILIRVLARPVKGILGAGCIAICGLIIGFPYVAFIRTDRDYVADYPESRTSVYWSFTDVVPENVYFGFPHKVGWKAIGELHADQASLGLYNSNEIPRITNWYTQWGRRTGCPSPDYYVVDPLHPADKFDSANFDQGAIGSEYGLVEIVTVAGEPRLAVYKRGKAAASPVMYRAEDFGSSFDNGAVPDRWFVASPIASAGSTHAEFGDGIRLVGYTLETQSVAAGDSLRVLLHWRTTQLVEESYVVFVHLIKDGVLQQGGGDSLPDCGAQPTSLWVPGETVLDLHDIDTFPDADCADCGLFIGMYNLHTGERLPIVVDGQRMPGDTLLLTSVTVTPHSDGTQNSSD